MNTIRLCPALLLTVLGACTQLPQETVEPAVEVPLKRVTENAMYKQLGTNEGEINFACKEGKVHFKVGPDGQIRFSTDGKDIEPNDRNQSEIQTPNGVYLLSGLGFKRSETEIFSIIYSGTVLRNAVDTDFSITLIDRNLNGVFSDTADICQVPGGAIALGDLVRHNGKVYVLDLAPQEDKVLLRSANGKFGEVTATAPDSPRQILMRAYATNKDENYNLGYSPAQDLALLPGSYRVEFLVEQRNRGRYTGRKGKPVDIKIGQNAITIGEPKNAALNVQKTSETNAFNIVGVYLTNANDDQFDVTFNIAKEIVLTWRDGAESIPAGKMTYG